jgi:hypothetical protein
VYLCYGLLYLTLLVLLVLHIKTLDERRKIYVAVFVVAVVTTIILRGGSYVILQALNLEEYISDAALLINILLSTGIALTTSRMGQYDATVARVSLSPTHVTCHGYSNNC